jgi:hypothetical protein
MIDKFSTEKKVLTAEKSLVVCYLLGTSGNVLAIKQYADEGEFDVNYAIPITVLVI